MAQAPTGIGKTIGTVFPLLKACPGAGARQGLLPQRQGARAAALALDALALTPRAPALPLRVVELVARDKACEHPDKACHGDSCPLARGFYDRLPAGARGGGGQPARWTGRRCARSRWRTASAPTTWGRSWCAGPTWSSATTTTTSTAAPCCTADASANELARRRAGRRGAQPRRAGARDVHRRAGQAALRALRARRAGAR